MQTATETDNRDEPWQAAMGRNRQAGRQTEREGMEGHGMWGQGTGQQRAHVQG